MNKIITSNFKFILIALLLIESFSFLGNYFSFLGNYFFIIVSLIVLFLTLKDIRYGLWIVLAELLIGSQGYLFSLNLAGTSISIRMSIWFIVLAVWSSKILTNFYKKPRGERTFPNIKLFKSSYFSYLLILFFFVAWGGINGFINNNSLHEILFDINSWFYLALIFPLYEVAWKENFFKPLAEILLACAIWISLKSLFILFVFSHNIHSWMGPLYSWVRDTGVGEITAMDGGFTRVFFQSHIFIVIAIFLGIILINKVLTSKKELSGEDKKWILLYSAILILFSSVVIISFSRSFWIGSMAGILFLLAIVQKKYGFKNLILNILGIFSMVILSLGLVAAIINIPVIGEKTDLRTSESVRDRARDVSGEAAVSSRWNLLPKMWEEIKSDPVLGKGFGTTITYISSDPRALQRSAEGEYTTYAFEWGWLDIWLKIGFLGLLCYLFLIAKMIFDGLAKPKLFKSTLGNCLIIGLMVFIVVHFFTPYLNHPLGFGFLMLSIIALNKLEEDGIIT